MTIDWAMNSRKSVLAEDKFKDIFSEYAQHIGINDEVKIEEWDKLAKFIEEKKVKIAE